MPFLGDAAEARQVLKRLGALRLGPGDEVLVADNTPGAIVAGEAGPGIRVIHAPERRSASHARNAGAEAAGGDWLLFLDADCLLPPDLLDSYFDPPPGERCGVLAGEVVGDPAQSGTLARWSRSRRGHWVEGLLATGLRPAGVTANLLVRRSAFEDAGGLIVGGGADFDLCWRLQDAGWELERRPRALVRHRDRDTLRALGDQARGYGSHQRNLLRLHGQAPPSATLGATVRSLGAAAAWRVKGERERARFAALDAYYHANSWLGARGLSSRTRRGD